MLDDQEQSQPARDGLLLTAPMLRTLGAVGETLREMVEGAGDPVALRRALAGQILDVYAIASEAGFDTAQYQDELRELAG